MDGTVVGRQDVSNNIKVNNYQKTTLKSKNQ